MSQTVELDAVLLPHDKVGVGPNSIPVAVMQRIIKAWPDQAVEILREIQFAGDHYSFTRWGMYVGVEYDGYIHT